MADAVRGPARAVIVFGVAGLLAAGLVVAGAWPAWTAQLRPTWEDRAGAIVGVRDFHRPPLERQHAPGRQRYRISPPVGGRHHPYWQKCNGVIYDKPIPSEHAVHSMEHGAVWVTYRPGLPAREVELLASRVRGKDFLFMSPYPGLASPISLQAWGWQLRVDSARDQRIDDFIRELRVNAAPEPGAVCSGGLTRTGAEPAPVTSPGMRR